MIAIIDYDTGNLCSVSNVLKRLGADFCVTSDAAVICAADKVLLPGVGAASSAMQKLHERGLCHVVRQLKQPVLGICVGMQIMCRRSQEGDVDCLGIFDTDVMRFAPCKEQGVKVPHMGWNSIGNLRSPLFNGVENGSYVYFVHSYAPNLCPEAVAIASNGRDFAAALAKDNFYGTQFHPEKSGDVGEAILKNFIDL